MNVNSRIKKVLSFLLVLCLVLQYVPAMVLAAPAASSQCYCAEQRTEDSTNEYCDICAVEYNACIGEDVAAVCATSGTCGENLTWDLDGSTLMISGTGAMTDYDSTSFRGPVF